MIKQQIKTRDEAIWYAIGWQKWASEQNLSLGELAEWHAIFTELADRFGLQEEFTENGII